MSQLYALLKNGQLRYVDLAEDIVESTRELFVNAANELMDAETVEEMFDGDYINREDENEISYIEMPLPEAFNDIPDNQMGLTTLDIEHDEVKSLFWYEEGAFLFQMFSNSNLLESKYIVKFLQEEHNFNRLTEKAFIINNKIQAIYKNGKFYFQSFPSASKILDLSAYMVAATTEGVRNFGNKDNINIDVDWLLARANNKTRRLIKMVTETGTLDNFMEMDGRKRGKIAKSVKVEINIVNGRLVLPSNIGQVNKILEFLNEDVYKGLISSNIFRTNSKKKE